MRALDDVIAAGIGFLERDLATRAGGLWCDFVVPGVSAGSTECVSAFIAAQLGEIPEGRMLAAGVVDTLALGARDTGGWGYRADVPEDCDSTAWVLLAAAAAGVDLPPAVLTRATSCIVAHQRDVGGFATYRPEAKASLTPADQPGWFAPEISVTSSAVLALATTGYRDAERIRSACSYIARSRVHGLWRSYWWNGFAYATHLALLALSQAAPTTCELLCAGAERAMLARRSPGGGWANSEGSSDNGFSTSLVVLALLRSSAAAMPREALLGTASYLRTLMHASGACAPSTEMLAPGALHGADAVLLDGGTVTTACVVRALHELRTALRAG
jgi:hypothetical protein